MNSTLNQQLTWLSLVCFVLRLFGVMFMGSRRFSAADVVGYGILVGGVQLKIASCVQ
jgi:hypothetical protein